MEVIERQQAQQAGLGQGPGSGGAGLYSESIAQTAGDSQMAPVFSPTGLSANEMALLGREQMLQHQSPRQQGYSQGPAYPQPPGNPPVGPLHQQAVGAARQTFDASTQTSPPREQGPQAEAAAASQPPTEQSERSWPEAAPGSGEQPGNASPTPLLHNPMMQGDEGDAASFGM